jgi:hypothetical protein
MERTGVGHSLIEAFDKAATLIAEAIIEEDPWAEVFIGLPTTVEVCKEYGELVWVVTVKGGKK